MMGGSYLFFVYILIIFWFANNEAKVYQKEVLFGELMQKYNLSETLATKLTCLAGATNYDTSYNVSREHFVHPSKGTNIGIFGISSIICSSFRGICNNTCANFLDADITDDLFCARKIFENHVDMLSAYLLTDAMKFECQWLMKNTAGCTGPTYGSSTHSVHHGYEPQKHLPHMAALGWTNTLDPNVTWSCGGSLITEDTILTAAHCTVRGGKPVDVIRLGDSSLLTDDNDNEKVQQYEVASIIRHPDHIGKYNDIALIKFKGKAKLSETVIPACLWMDYAFPTSSKMFGTGYGQTDEAGPISAKLLEYVQTTFEISACSEYYQKQRGLERGLDDKVHLCAHDKTGRNMDACQGDSGGPLELRLSLKSTVKVEYGPLLTNDWLKVPFITGIVSFGKKCLDYEDPGVYTRVSTYIDWIRSHCPELPLNSLHCAIQYEQHQNIVRGINGSKLERAYVEGNIFGEHSVPEGVTGVVITDRYVLASAQKLRKITQPNRILLDQIFFIQEIIYHPGSTNLNQGKRLAKDDVALIKLTRPVGLNDLRAPETPVCIGSRIRHFADPPSYGIKGLFYDQTHDLLFFDLQDLHHCLSYFSIQLLSLDIESNNLLCFDSHTKYVPGLCHLSVGSPVYGRPESLYMTEIKGFVLLSDNCGPTIATNVEAYADWLDSILTNKQKVLTKILPENSDRIVFRD